MNKLNKSAHDLQNQILFNKLECKCVYINLKKKFCWKKINNNKNIKKMKQ